ncbi:MAG TPA: 3'-5' exonuclease [Bacteroidales bacterium]|jgi:predicted PolB exonuclease-like 3'-5' exonuclease|nr:3'-5' exonuclease [Bacteroidales bacterium]
MLNSINLKHILFLDIETVPQHSSFEDAPDKEKLFWEKKSSFFRSNEQTAEDVYQRAGIYAEFGKIICISVGVLFSKSDYYGLRLKSFSGKNELDLLTSFVQLIEKMEKKHPVILCAHNGKEFDYPYISRRLLINGLTLPESLNNAGKKPWEVKHLDTLELWKFGDYKHYTSLDLLTHVFHIPSPKEEIDGSMVAEVFYQQNDLNKIVAYCENDVEAVAQLFMRYMNKSLIKPEMIERTIFN